MNHEKMNSHKEHAMKMKTFKIKYAVEMNRVQQMTVKAFDSEDAIIQLCERIKDRGCLVISITKVKAAK